MTLFTSRRCSGRGANDTRGALAPQRRAFSGIAAAVVLTKKLVADDQVLVIKGTSRSDNTEAAFNYLNELEKQGTPIALLSSASASPGLGKISKWGFRNAFFEGELVARETKLLHDKL